MQIRVQYTEPPRGCTDVPVMICALRRGKTLVPLSGDTRRIGQIGVAARPGAVPITGVLIRGRPNPGARAFPASLRDLIKPRVLIYRRRRGRGGGRFTAAATDAERRSTELGRLARRRVTPVYYAAPAHLLRRLISAPASRLSPLADPDAPVSIFRSPEGRSASRV